MIPIEKVHFFSNGPSQFKQKYLSSNLEHWEKELLYKLKWHSFTTSHGKGVVDGIGGSMKGSVHCKILSGRVIQTAKQVAEVAQACHTIVVIKYVSANDITHDKAMLDIVCTSLFLLEGWASSQIFRKTSTFIGGCWERGGDFFQGRLQFSHEK